MKEYNKNNLKKKIFIFMVHLFRIEKELNKNFHNLYPNQNFISHLDGFTPIFIDNLNGLIFSIKGILKNLIQKFYQLKN